MSDFCHNHYGEEEDLFNAVELAKELRKRMKTPQAIQVASEYYGVDPNSVAFYLEKHPRKVKEKIHNA